MNDCVESKKQQLGNLAWCAQVALRLHLREVGDKNDDNAHYFLVDWLKRSYEDDKIHKDVKEDISWLLQQAQKFGKDANIIRKINYLWHMATGYIIDNADMLNLTKAINFAKSLDWNYLLYEEGVNLMAFHAIKGKVNKLLVCMQSLDNAFDSYGKQTQPIKSIITGDTSSLAIILNEFGWRLTKQKNNIFSQPHDNEYYLTSVGLKI